MTSSTHRPAPQTVVVEDRDPRCRQLEEQGWVQVAESWGARLHLDEPPDLAHQQAVVEAARTAGLALRELGPADTAALCALEASTRPDYPTGPATPRPDWGPAAVEALWAAGGRAFGAFDRTELVGATVIEPPEPAVPTEDPDPSTRPAADTPATTVETGTTSVRASHRRRGIGATVKAASVVALAAEGVRTFRTGGAGDNAASLGANRAVGYTVTERWLTYREPTEPPAASEPTLRR